MDELYHNAELLGNALKAHQLTVSTAESCTGGGIAYALTSVPGSSEWFGYGWITYSNEAKHRLLDVPMDLITAQGAVSEEVVAAMARGALARSAANISIAVSGIAGPGGGTPDKPVGTVCFAWAGKRGIQTKQMLFQGDRESIRKQSIIYAIQECGRLVQVL